MLAKAADDLLIRRSCARHSPASRSGGPWAAAEKKIPSQVSPSVRQRIPASSQPVPHGARPARRTSAPFGYHGSGHEGSSSATAVTMAFAMARPMGKSPNNSDHRRRMHKHGRGIAHFCQPCRKIGFSCLKTLYPCLHRPVIWLVLGSGHESRVLCLGPRQGLAGGAFDCKNRGLFLSLGVDDFTVRHFESS